MNHLGCGGTVALNAIVPYCAKCGKSKMAVERDNTRYNSAPPPPPSPQRRVERNVQVTSPKAPPPPSFNTKRFKSEAESLLHRCEKAEALALEANALFIKANHERFKLETYEKVRKMYKQAAQIARDDEDHVSNSLFDTMDSMIDQAIKDHQERRSSHVDGGEAEAQRGE